MLWHGYRAPAVAGVRLQPVSIGTLPTRVPAAQPGPLAAVICAHHGRSAVPPAGDPAAGRGRAVGRRRAAAGGRRRRSALGRGPPAGELADAPRGPGSPVAGRVAGPL